MKVAPLTLPGNAGTPTERRAWAERAVARAAAAGADLVVLPEAWFPGYAHRRADAEAEARAFATAQPIHVVTGFLQGDGSLAGVGGPDGSWATYRKRFPTPDESRFWEAGTEPGIVPTPLGRVGLLICADVLQPRAWADLAGRVDVVAVCAAWPDYVGRVVAPPLRPVLAWLRRASAPHRDALLASGAAATGATVVFADAAGRWQGREGFTAGSGVWSPDGTVVRGANIVAEARSAAPGPPVQVGKRWALFGAVYEGARTLAARGGGPQ